MNTLRVKVIVLLISAITIVLVVASSVTIFILNAPNKSLMVENVTTQVRLVASLVEKLPPDAVQDRASTATSMLSASTIDLQSTALLTAALAQARTRASITIYNQPGQFGQLVRIELPDNRSLTIPIAPMRFPSTSWIALISWMALVLIGMIVVAVLTANWITRPLALLQSINSKVDPNGLLPTISEEGPAEIRATALAINLLSANLRRAMESRMRLVAAAGHDLRTPMTRMRLRAEFIENEAERRPWLRDIGELDRIADSAIGLVREEVSAAGGEPVQLQSLLANLITDLNQLGFDITVGTLDSVQINAGPLALTRAIRNLLINAATHGKKASIRLVVERDGGTIIVEDQGPGIPTHLLDQVFEPFFRVDFARQQSVPGAGLGLAIAKEIIQRYGGTIKLENIPTGLVQRIRFVSTVP